MPELVFVHGVATRSGPGHEQATRNRDALFKEVLFHGCQLNIYSPLWGDLVPPVNPKVFATDEMNQSFSLGIAPATMGSGLGGAATSNGSSSLSDVAASDPAVALDAIFAELVDQADRNGSALESEEIEAFREAANAIEGNEAKLALRGADSDEAIVLKLRQGMTASYGLRSTIGDAVASLTDRLRNAISTVGFAAVRDSISPAVALFLGDVFAYLGEGALRRSIQARIAADLLKAHKAVKAGGGPLVVIGHSMGGVILTDMFKDLVASGLPSDFRVAAFLSVGSQPGLFQSVGALSNIPAGRGKVSKPDCVGTWFNVFDPIDPLAFRADMIFEGVEDFPFDSITGLASAHTTYFKRPQFHARCRSRLRKLNIV